MADNPQDTWLGALGIDVDQIRSKVQGVVSDVEADVEQGVDNVVQGASQLYQAAANTVSQTVQNVENAAGKVVDTAKKDVDAAKVKALGDQSGKPVPRPIEADCKPEHGYVPGPKNHLLCATHGHVVDTDQGMIIAESVAAYAKQGAAAFVDAAKTGLSQAAEDIDPSAAVAAIRGGRGDPPAGDLDEGEGRNRDGTVRRKAGDHGRFRGREGKRADDADFDDVVKEFDLDPDEARELHDAIGGRNLGKDGIRKEAEALFPDKAKSKGSKDAEDPEPESNSGDATNDKVTRAVIAIGISLVLIPSIVVAVLDPEPVSKLVALGLTLLEIEALAAALGFPGPSASQTPEA